MTFLHNIYFQPAFSISMVLQRAQLKPLWPEMRKNSWYVYTWHILCLHTVRLEWTSQELSIKLTCLTTWVFVSSPVCGKKHSWLFYCSPRTVFQYQTACVVSDLSARFTAEEAGQYNNTYTQSICSFMASMKRLRRKFQHIQLTQ